jgi:hypothetical protein
VKDELMEIAERFILRNPNVATGDLLKALDLARLLGHNEGREQALREVAEGGL